MVNTEANLLRTSASIVQDALKIEQDYRTIGVSKDRLQDAEQHTLNAGNLLRIAILRWIAVHC